MFGYPNRKAILVANLTPTTTFIVLSYSATRGMSFSLCVCALSRTYRSQFLRLRPEIRNIRPSRDWEEAFFLF